MNWSTVWKLTKMNILYSSPQSVTVAKQKQERKPSKGFSAYKSVMRSKFSSAFCLRLFTFLCMLTLIFVISQGISLFT